MYPLFWIIQSSSLDVNDETFKRFITGGIPVAICQATQSSAAAVSTWLDFITLAPFQIFQSFQFQIIIKFEVKLQYKSDTLQFSVMVLV